jgi:hypothetical protein
MFSWVREKETRMRNVYLNKLSTSVVAKGLGLFAVAIFAVAFFAFPLGAFAICELNGAEFTPVYIVRQATILPQLEKSPNSIPKSIPVVRFTKGATLFPGDYAVGYAIKQRDDGTVGPPNKAFVTCFVQENKCMPVDDTGSMVWDLKTSALNFGKHQDVDGDNNHSK